MTVGNTDNRGKCKFPFLLRIMNNSIITNYDPVFCCCLITDIASKTRLVLNLSQDVLQNFAELKKSIGDKDHSIREKVFKNGPSKISGR